MRRVITHNKRNILIFILLSAIIIFTYSNLSKTFYQQDEWLALGQAKALGLGYIWYGLNPFQVLFADGRPLTRLLIVLVFTPFAYNSLFLTFYDVGFHIANTMLIYFIAKKLFKNYILSFLAALFFAVCSVTSQSVSWFGAAFGLQPGSFLIFLSLYLFLCYLEKKSARLLQISSILAVISLYLKEDAIILFIFYPFVDLIYSKKKKYWVFIRKYIIFLVFGILFIAFRLTEMIFLGTSSHGTNGGAVFSTIGTQDLYLSLAIRALLYPLTSLSLIFFPPPLADNMGILLHDAYYPYITARPDQVALTANLDLAATIFSGCLIAWLVFLFKRIKSFQFPIFFSLSLFIFSILPYIVATKGYAYLEPRYYYIASAGAGLLFAIIIYGIYALKKNILVFIFLAIFITGYVFIQIKTIRSVDDMQVFLASQRRSFIQQLYSLKPTLNRDKNIFFVTGSMSNVAPGNFTPFQNGPGYTLMVLYFNSGKVPLLGLEEGSFFALGDEGYVGNSEYGFGYYYNFNQLKDDLKKKIFVPADVTGLDYNYSTMKLSDITSSVRGKLQ